MGVTARFLLASAVVLSFTPCVFAIPKLRLTNSVVGPISVAAGQAGPAQEIEAFNAGDGNLNLQFQSSPNWVQATAGGARACSRQQGDCIPIRLALNTQQLAAGSHTATVRVLDAGAADAPQEVLVIVNVGGGVPDRLEFFVPPGGQDESMIHLNRCTGSIFGPACMSVTESTASGGRWLSLAVNGEGSFRFNVPYRVQVRHLEGMAEGTYQGSVAIADSQFAPDNKTMPVMLRVTSQPIAQAGARELRLRAAQGGRRVSQGVAVTNRGGGTLTLSGAAAETSSGGSWLAVEQAPGAVAVHADPAGLNTGIYTGTVTLTGNAVNSPLRLPVTFEVVAQGPPRTAFRGVANNANFDAEEPLSQGMIAAAFGEQFTLNDPVAATSLPLSTQLGDVQVFINDRQAPVYYASYGQVNFQVPYDAALGDALIRIDRGGQRGNSVSTRLVGSLPRLLRFFNGLYGIAVNQDGSFPLPASLGIPNSRPARVGDTLVFYALGLGQTNPPVQSGAAAPANPLARVPSPGGPRMLFGALALPTGAPSEPSYVGLTPGFVGLYQINVQVPEGVVSGDVPVRLQLDTVASDYVLIAVQ